MASTVRGDVAHTNRANVKACGHMSVTSRFYGGSPIRNRMGGRRVRGREEQKEGGGGKGGRKVEGIMAYQVGKADCMQSSLFLLLLAS